MMILDAGFDGVNLDVVDAALYFRKTMNNKQKNAEQIFIHSAFYIIVAVTSNYYIVSYT